MTNTNINTNVSIETLIRNETIARAERHAARLAYRANMRALRRLARAYAAEDVANNRVSEESRNAVYNSYYQALLVTTRESRLSN